MSSRAIKSFAWLWIAALLTATVGVSVQQIYCYCLGKATVSFFSIQHTCAAEKRTDVSDCCRRPSSRPAHSCCEQKAETCTNEQGGCMEKSTKVFQLKTEFVVDKPFEKNYDCPLWIEKMPVFRRFLRPVVCETIFTDKSPPPPLSGRDICLRLQIFRC
ncbi:MAG TPA: hypothetical protein PK228_05065 [Saprospiraceae bacterium]|nr:hypothetical protein [Saprospiraceae bacterium]